MNLREIHARMKAAAAVARLPLESGRWTGAAGTVLGRGTGSSVDFQDQRHYVPGDDPRHLNWQAFARTGHYTMKLYREEVTPRIDLVYDASGSMFLDAAKESRVWELFYFCLESGLRLGAHVRLFLLGRAAADQPVELPIDRVLGDDWPAHVGRFRHAADGGGRPAASPADEGVAEPAALAEQIDRLPLRPGSLHVLVSDVLDESAPGRIAAALAGGRGRGLVLAPFSRGESAPDWSGNVEFADVERGSRRRQHVSGDLLERYRAAYRRHHALWREACASRGVGFAQVAAAGDFLAALRGEAVPAGLIEMGRP